MLHKRPISIIMFFAIALTVSVRWFGMSGQNYISIINSDGRGYYQYFESLFGPEPMDEQQANGTFLLQQPDSTVVNKYFVGTALLWSPFVLPVYTYYRFAGETPIDFYAPAFQIAVSIAALFYLFVGLWFLKKLLKSFDLEDKIISFTLFAFFFGTNLSYYSIIAPSMSHLYSFSLITAFLYSIRRFSISQYAQYLIYAAVILGLIVLVWPVNLMVIAALPIVWKGKPEIYKLLQANRDLIMLSLFLFGMIVAMQMVFWYFQSGKLIRWSYAGEGFYFLHPRFIDFVFSFRKGFLIYTPLLWFSFYGIYRLFKLDWTRFVSSLIFVFLLIYIFSSWWNWYYGDSFGSRVMIDFYAIFALLYAMGLQQTRKRWRPLIASVSLLLIGLNLFQSYQYYHNIMSHYDMDREKYAYIFLKGGEKYENVLGGNRDIAPYHKKPMVLLTETNGIAVNDYFRISVNTASREWPVKVEREVFPCSILVFPEKIKKYRSIYVEMTCEYESNIPDLSDVYWTLSMSNGDNQYYYYAFRINAVPLWKNKRRSDFYSFSIPSPVSSDDRIIIALWNKGRRSFKLQSLHIKFYGVDE